MARRYRDTVNPVGVETRFSDPGTVDFQSQLLQATRQVTAAAMSVAEPIAIAKGQREGAKAGAAGQGAPVRGLAAGSPYGRGYNSAYEATYVSKLQGDLKAKADEIERQYGDEPAAFHQAFVTATKAQLDATPDEYKQTVRLITQGQYQDMANRVAVRYRAKTGALRRAAFDDTIPARVEQQVSLLMSLPEGEWQRAATDWLTAMDAEIEGDVAEGHREPEEAVKIKANVRAMLDAAFKEARVSPRIAEITTLLQHDVPRGMKALADLSQDESLSAEDKADIIDAALKFRNDDRTIKAGLYQPRTTDVAMRLAADEHSAALDREIDTLNRLGAYTDDEYTGLKSRLAGNRKAAADKAKAADDARTVLTGGAFSVANAEHRRLADAQFSADYGIYPPMSPQWKEGANAYVKRFGYLPTPATEALIQMAAPGVPAGQQMKAALFYDDMKAASPLAMPFNVDTKIDSQYTQLAKQFRANMDPDIAVSVVRDRVYNQQPATREIRAKELREQALMKNPRALREQIRSRLDDQFNAPGIFNGVPEIPSELFESVLTQIESHWEYDPSATFNEVVGRAIDGAVRNSQWGLTQINGDWQLVKRPPESAFRSPGDTDGADPDVIRDIARYHLEFMVGQAAPDVDPKRVELVAIPGVTDRSGDPRSSAGVQWGVRVQDEYGNWEPVLGPDNRKIIYVTPDPVVARHMAVRYAEEQARKQPVAPGRAPPGRK